MVVSDHLGSLCNHTNIKDRFDRHLVSNEAQIQTTNFPGKFRVFIPNYDNTRIKKKHGKIDLNKSLQEEATTIIREVLAGTSTGQDMVVSKPTRNIQYLSKIICSTSDNPKLSLLN